MNENAYIYLKKNDPSWSAEEVKYMPSEQFNYTSKNQKSRVLGNFDFTYHQNIILFGLKDLDVVYEIYKKISGKTSLLLIEMTDQSEVYLEGRLSKFQEILNDQRVVLLIGDEDRIEEDILKILRGMQYIFNLKNTKIITMPYLKSKYPNQVQAVFNSIFETMHTVTKILGNSIEDILYGIDNFVNNWKYYLQGVHATLFQDILKGKPCIIVGAGPSLDHEISELKKVEKYVTVIAVDAALNTLLDNGIVPDIVATIERSEKTFKFYTKYDDMGDIVFLGPNMIRGEVLQRFNRRVFSGRYEDRIINAITSLFGFINLDIGFNVAHLPYAFACFIGCNPIVFIGLDLAYTEGKTHSKEVAHNIVGNNAYRIKENIMKVKGKNGEVLETFNFFLYAKKWFESKFLTDKSRRIINSTSGGVEIVGAQNIELEKVIQPYIDESVMKQPFCQLYDSEFQKRDYDPQSMTEKLIQFFETMNQQFEAIKKTMSENTKAMSKISYTRMVDKIYELEDAFFQQRESYVIPIFFLQSEYVLYNRRLREYGTQPTRSELEEMKQIAIEYYHKVVLVSSKIQESIHAYVQVLNLNLKQGVNLNGTIDSSDQ